MCCAFFHSPAAALFVAMLFVSLPYGFPQREYPGGFIGEVRNYKVAPGESLLEIGRRFDLGYNEIHDANRGIDPLVPKAGTVVTIPVAWIPPSFSVRPCLVINLAEFRLYYLPRKPGAQVQTFPIGIGDEASGTPLGSYSVIDKIVNPSWHVPSSIRSKRPDLPPVIPPGPENPLGSHALRLSRNDILIHGTNRPGGVGRRSSHGCLRLYPEDIVRLFRSVETGTKVFIVDQPVKVGLRGERIFVEIHGDKGDALGPGDVLRMMASRGLLRTIDLGKLVRAVEEKRGYPVEVTWTK